MKTLRYSFLFSCMILLLVFPGKVRAGLPPAESFWACAPETCWTLPELDQFGSVFAQRPIKVDCYEPEQWNTLWYGAWGVTYMDPLFSSVEIDGSLCDAAFALSLGWPEADARWREAAAVLVILHEAYHAKYWKWRQDEARVECAAIRSFDDGLKVLTGDNFSIELLKDLKPWALALHWRLVRRNPQYYLESCKVPWPY